MQLEDAFEFINDNAIRIKGTRVGIEIVIERYNEGWSPERMAHEYPALDLKKIYTTITIICITKKSLMHTSKRVGNESKRRGASNAVTRTRA